MREVLKGYTDLFWVRRGARVRRLIIEGCLHEWMVLGRNRILERRWQQALPRSLQTLHVPGLRAAAPSRAVEAQYHSPV